MPRRKSARFVLFAGLAVAVHLAGMALWSALREPVRRAETVGTAPPRARAATTLQPLRKLHALAVRLAAPSALPIDDVDDHVLARLRSLRTDRARTRAALGRHAGALAGGLRPFREALTGAAPLDPSASHAARAAAHIGTAGRAAEDAR